MTYRFRLQRTDGTPADPPTLDSAIPNWPRAIISTSGEGELAPQVGAAVLAVAFQLGICEVDVIASNHTRPAEHESHGPGC